MNIQSIQDIADRGDPVAQLMLGVCYENGFGIDHDYLLALKHYKSAADSGLRLAQYGYARLVWQEGITDSYELAIMYVEKAAEQNLGEAQDLLGLLYEYGIQVSQNINLAIEWYSKAARNNCAKSADHLGKMYENGIGVVQDIDAAISWYEMAVKNGCADSAYSLAELYKNGDKINKNYQLSVNWYKEAAKLGSYLAHGSLALIYDQGLLGQKRDPEKAKEHTNSMRLCKAQKKSSVDRDRVKLIEHAKRIL